MSKAYLSLGSNTGDRAAHLQTAIERLNVASVRVTAVSRVYETAHVGDTEESIPSYLNCAAEVETELEPLALLRHTQSVEQAGGRERTRLWSPRTIDIDILLYDGVTLESPALTVPHPRMHERAFVLVPLLEIAPYLAMPNGSTIEQILNDSAARSQDVSFRDDYSLLLHPFSAKSADSLS
jgi:2-amino-4-hydroxy-6-hydroxymethyldihydropteridine diphosphokinase